jgi:hypothetical protein
MFCGRCGAPIPVDSRFCPRCGNAVLVVQHSVPPPAIPATIAASNRSTAPDVTGNAYLTSQPVLAATASPESRPPTYAVFAVQILSSALLASLVVFNVADEAARGHWSSTLPSIVAALILLFVVGLVVKGWHRLRDTDRENNVSYGKKILSRGVVFTLLFMFTAGIVGNAIGRNGDEAAQMASDFRTMSLVGDRISQARNAVDRTIASHVEMYKSIEGDVEQFDTILQRLRTEINLYDGKFPSQHDETAKSIQSIEIGIKRATLLKKQIEVAKEIEPLGPDAQWDEWQHKMQPLLDEEDALDK